MLRPKPVTALIAMALVFVACTDDAEPETPASPSPSIDGAVADTGLVDVGGYELHPTGRDPDPGRHVNPGSRW